MGRWLGLALAIALVSGGGCARAATPMSMATFREAYAAEVRHRQPDAKVEVVAPDQLSITLRSGAQITAMLDNAYDHYRAEPSQLRSVLNGYVTATLESATPPSYTAAQLLVLVRPVSYAQAHAAMMSASPEAAKHGPLLTRPIAGDLVAMVVVDQPTTYQFIPGSTLRAQLKLDDAGIWARALANTLRQLPPVPAYRGMLGYTTGKGLAASALADPVSWDSAAMQKGGPPIVAPVDKDLLLVEHLNDAGAPKDLRADAVGMRGSEERLSQQLFVRRNGAWEVLPP